MHFPILILYFDYAHKIFTFFPFADMGKFSKDFPKKAVKAGGADSSKTVSKPPVAVTKKVASAHPITNDADTQSKRKRGEVEIDARKQRRVAVEKPSSERSSGTCDIFHMFIDSFKVLFASFIALSTFYLGSSGFIAAENIRVTTNQILPRGLTYDPEVWRGASTASTVVAPKRAARGVSTINRFLTNEQFAMIEQMSSEDAYNTLPSAITQTFALLGKSLEFRDGLSDERRAWAITEGKLRAEISGLKGALRVEEEEKEKLVGKLAERETELLEKQQQLVTCQAETELAGLSK